MTIINKKGTYIRDNNSTTKIMRNLFIALLPIILFAFYKNGYLPYKNNKTGISGLFYPLIFIIVPAFTSFITEIIWYRLIKRRKGTELLKTINSSFSIFPGLFLGLILPINTPLSIVILGSIFASVIGKLVYGGFGHNAFNPALIGRLFIISTYALVITNKGGYLNPMELDAVTKATPLSNALSNINYDTFVKPYGNLWDFFIGTIPGSMGETSALLCLIGFIYLTVKRVIKPIIPTMYILTVFVMTFVIGLINGVGLWYPLFQILSGGLMFGAIFMATDPVTSPVTKTGQLLYGICLGILTVIFRFLTPYPEGVLTSILTMNMLVFIIDRIGLKARNKKKYIVMPLIIIILLGSYITYNICGNFDKQGKDYEIVSKEKDDSKITYIINTKGYSSTIEAKIVIKDNKVLSYEVLKQNDSFYKTVDNNDYINTLIKNQNALSELDTVTGATITSTALKRLLVAVIDDYTDGKGFKKEEVKKEESFEVLSKEVVDLETIYVINQKSFGGKIKLQVTTLDNVITNIEVLETYDSYFDKLYEEDYISKLIENQDNLENLDTVAGATISSGSMKKAIEAVIKLEGEAYEES